MKDTDKTKGQLISELQSLRQRSAKLETLIANDKGTKEQWPHNQEYFQALVENCSDMIMVLNTDGTIRYVSPSNERISGYTLEELAGRSGFDFVHPDDLPALASLFTQSIQTPESTASAEFRSRHKDGSWRYLAATGKNLTENPAVAGIVVNIHDMTERKQLEETLRQSEERYRTILDEMEEGYYEVDLAGNYTFVNDSQTRITGYSKEELIGMNYRVYTPKADVKSIYKVFNQVYRTGEPVKWYPMVNIRKDGTPIFVEDSVSPLRNNEGEIIGFRGVSRDVTDRKKAEEERKELEQKAQLASRLASVGEMAAGIAHEINNPLTGVIGYSDLLLQRKDLPESTRKGLQNIGEGAERVAGIVERLLTFARQQKPHREFVNINEIINNTLSLRAYYLETNNIKVITQFDPDLPITIADAGQLQQIFLNLIVNAEKEMKLAHGKGKFTIKTERVNSTIKISFKDDGPGIPKESIDRIFDPFFTTREVGQGTGLGLSVCHGIITEHNGRIYAQSQLGKGATFIVELPIVTEPEQLKLAEPTAEEPKKMARANILVVDDEPTVRQLLTEVLTEEGHGVETVDNADHALELIKDNRYSLILLDIKMPGMTGIELYKRTQKIALSLARRIVFITGDVIETDTQEFLAKTKAHHIDKPFNIEQLKKVVNHTLAQG